MRERPSGQRGDADRDHRAGNQPARKVEPTETAAPPAAPMTSVSSVSRILARLGMANAIDAGIRLTPPYGKSARAGTNASRDCSNARARAGDGPPASSRSARPGMPSRGTRGGYFALSAAAFLHSDAEFLALLAVQGPWRRLPSSIRARLRCAVLLGLLFRRRLVFGLSQPRAMAGAVVCANAGPSAARRRRRSRWQAGRYCHHGAPRIEGRAQRSRCDAEPRMNEQLRRGSAPQYFDRTNRSRVVASRGCARMGACRSPCPKETKDDHSSKNTVRDCGVGFCRARGDVAGACPDRAGMQRQIPGRQDRRHARRPEVERLPQSAMRRRRRGGAPPPRPLPPPARAGSAEAAKPAEGSRDAAAAARACRQARRCIRPPSIRNIPRKAPARRACTPASISTTPTRPPTPMAA